MAGEIPRHLRFVLDLRRETRSPLQGPTPAHPGVAGLQECYVTGLCQRSSPHIQASTALIHVKSRCGLTALPIVPWVTLAFKSAFTGSSAR